MKIKFVFLSLIFIMVLQQNSFAKVILPEIFSDHMVLQRNSEVKIWGWARPGETVRVSPSWSSSSFEALPNKEAYWEVNIPTPDLRGPHQIKIKGHNEILIENVLLGEVWLVSGQSNMEWSADAGITNAEEAIAGAENSEIRFFTVIHKTSEYPQQDVVGEWVSSSPESMRSFSAVAYFFAQKLHKELGVPIGLINSSWGGTPAEVWMPEEVFSENDELAEAAALIPEVDYRPNSPGSLYNAMIAPLIPFKLAGVLWYQGESNTDNAQYYEETFENLIKSWRNKWKEDFPFYYAQIAPYDYGDNFSGVQVRDAQRRVLDLPKTGMIMTSDIGNPQDIHPRNKLDVGLRFARLALAEVYGKEDMQPYSATVKKAVIEKSGQVKLIFSNAEGLRFTNDKKLFEVAGVDKVFYPVSASIKEGSVVLKSNKVSRPQFVRFAWGNTVESNLFNAAGLPTSSFSIAIEP